MPEAFSIGPFLVPTRLAGFLVSAVLAVWLVRRVALFLKVDATVAASIAEHSLWIGVIASRLGYVISNWDAFEDNPWTALYLWQPGYSFVAGVSTALIYILYRIYKQNAALCHPITASLCAGFTVPILLYMGILVTMNRFVDANVLVPGDSVPQYQFIDMNGDQVSFEEFKGQGIVLNFWATWCSPCRREMPLLESIYQEYKNRGITIIGISVGESRETVLRYVDSVGVTYPVWGDRVLPDQNNTESVVLSDRFNVVGLPTTFFINQKGTIKSSYVGELNRAILQERILELVPGPGDVT